LFVIENEFMDKWFLTYQWDHEFLLITDTIKGEEQMEKNVFEQMAKRYDTEERMELAQVIVKQVKKELHNSSTKSLIDYGSGTGLVGLELSNLVDTVLLVDSSKQMSDIAGEKITRKGITNSK